MLISEMCYKIAIFLCVSGFSFGLTPTVDSLWRFI